MVTMQVAAKNAYLLGGNDSFIEDWLETGKNSRTTHIRNGWKRKPTGEWHAFSQAKYSVNSWDLVKGKRSFNYRLNWDGGVAKDSTGEFYYMVSGGKETNPTTKNPSIFKIERTFEKPQQTPIKIISAKAKRINDQKISVEWESDPTTLPQFSYDVKVLHTINKKKHIISHTKTTTPHLRKTAISILKSINSNDIEIILQCNDILDNESDVLNFGL